MKGVEFDRLLGDFSRNCLPISAMPLVCGDSECVYTCLRKLRS